MVALMATVRWVKVKLLKQPEAQPEAWRLS